MGIAKRQAMKMMKNKIIAVVRCKDCKLAEKISVSLIAFGIEAIEITYTVEGAGKLIEDLKEKFPEVLIGAGTILNEDDAMEAISKGADFIVTPCLVEEVGVLCREKDVFCSLGAATPTEAFSACKLGADVVKLFPGSSFTPSYIKELKAPFPFMEFMPTGGVNQNNIREWFNCGAYAVGLGGYFTKGIDENNLSEMGTRVKDIFAALKALEKGNEDAV
ncbi:MAG: bifunctional 4-hydroxy-2-oxoglutarate aldolase/2-dehydro-3-deoxy-phosphogluconate aldolase [Clostridiaceae bacterium]